MNITEGEYKVLKEEEQQLIKKQEAIHKIYLTLNNDNDKDTKLIEIEDIILSVFRPLNVEEVFLKWKKTIRKE